MAKLVRELGPLAVATAVGGVVIGVLIANGNNIGSWLLSWSVTGGST